MRTASPVQLHYPRQTKMQTGLKPFNRGGWFGAEGEERGQDLCVNIHTATQCK